MATRVWLGGAVPSIEEKTFQFVAPFLAEETITVTIGSKSLVLTLGTGQVDVDEIASDVTDMINGSALNGTESRTAVGTDVPEFYGVEAATDGVDTVTVTGPTSYRPIAITMTTDSVSGTINTTTVTSATGPNSANNATNWSGGAVPVDDDDIVFDHRASASCLYHLDQLATVTPASITIDGFRYAIGLADVNTDTPSKSHDEYLDTYLQLCAAGDSTETKVYINSPQSERIRLNTQDGQATILVESTGARSGSEIASLMWLGTHASNAITIRKGEVGIAIGNGQSATVATLTLDEGGMAICGDGATLTTVNNYGGRITAQSNVTTLSQTGGACWFKSGVGTAATLGTANIRGGTLYYESSGTLTTLTVNKGGRLDCRNDPSARTFTNVNLYAGSEFHDPDGSVTATNGFDLVQCSPTEVVFDVQQNKTWTPTSI